MPTTGKLNDLVQIFCGLAELAVSELSVCLTLAQEEVEPDNSIFDAWDEILELPKDPRMLHGVKDVCTPTLR